MLSSLQLRSAGFLEFSLVAIENGKFEGDASFTQSIKVGPLANEPRRWRVELCLEVKSDPAKPFAYNGVFRAFGVIEAHPAFPEEKLPRAMELHGATLVYGVIREMVATVSSRSSKGLFLLPTLNFQAVLREDDRRRLAAPKKSSRRKA